MGEEKGADIRGAGMWWCGERYSSIIKLKSTIIGGPQPQQPTHNDPTTATYNHPITTTHPQQPNCNNQSITTQYNYQICQSRKQAGGVLEVWGTGVHLYRKVDNGGWSLLEHHLSKIQLCITLSIMVLSYTMLLLSKATKAKITGISK